ncbi:MAG: GGDEF domain-containing protein, partial [Gammaproteobacteria bacterium]|nr:GGDEF domain-containing protein [candidate division Zixibacteria bacterium]NIR93955.1 GGDEF domain-containing protein [Gammaproteobacteria bacterium]NIT57249.1 GGDEF domain-containing protein [Fodinibius sp.]NIR64216.1 GGDEF domain-containing protein [candidate division Zixibacteria bacterium]NIS46116.1 GGDEF domain-containing protein [candidate division Zixibacteria bacterium]
DTLVRLGGDEFAIMLPNTNREYAMMVGENIARLMDKPFQIDQQLIPVGISIGMARYPDDGTSADILIQHAD